MKQIVNGHNYLLQIQYKTMNGIPCPPCKDKPDYEVEQERWENEGYDI